MDMDMSLYFFRYTFKRAQVKFKAFAGGAGTRNLERVSLGISQRVDRRKKSRGKIWTWTCHYIFFATHSRGRKSNSKPLPVEQEQEIWKGFPWGFPKVLNYIYVCHIWCSII